ncbi:MAG: P1 family peptidase [Chloroflexota bacterium]|nr:P1 family peptidase [Chloroflexota bacterium]
MHHAISDVVGLEVGHAQDSETLTGCTVILCNPAAVVGVDVRGAAPGTRETDLCRPGTLVERANGILLTGGSAMGLAAANGVTRWLWERGMGFDTGVAAVPIVPGAVIFDLAIGAVAWPDETMGYAACRNAGAGGVAQGCVGAGTGATVGKILGPSQATKSGLGTASVRAGAYTVGALIVVNAFGDVVGPKGEILAGPRDPATGEYRRTEEILLGPGSARPGGNTTIGVVATDATLRDVQVSHLATAAHAGLARGIRPIHTMVDGDTIFALATGTVGTEVTAESLLALAVAATIATEDAVRNAIQHATPAGGLPAAHGAR